MLYDLKLVGLKDDEIEFLATMMEIKGIGMGDASKYVDSMPSILFEGIDASTAQKYKGMLEEVGAVIEVSHAGSSQAEPAAPAAPEPVAAPEPAAEPVVSVAPVVTPVVEEVVEAPKQTRTIPVIPSEETEPEPEAEPLPKPVPVEMPAQSVFQINDPNVTPEPVAEEEPVYYDINSNCPKCGSAFVSAKKVNGLFGGTKIKYVCSACKHKF